jgi:pyrroline-5-carboxylate reductase
MKNFHDKDFRIGFIGGGHICEALTRGIILSGYVDPGMIHISTLEDERRDELHKRLGVRTDKSNIEVSKLVDVLFLSVRPMELVSVCREISSGLSQDTLVVSVAAGVLLDRIIAALGGHKNTIRIMPNLPAKVRSSTTVVYSNALCDKSMLEGFKKFLAGFGEVLQISKEDLINPITVLSSSAPAYYVMIADAMIKYGVGEGIPEELCTRLVLDTMEGSAQWAMHSKDKPEDLWPQVVTKGGITAAGMEVFNNRGLIDIFLEGLKTATEKSRAVDKALKD